MAGSSIALDSKATSVSTNQQLFAAVQAKADSRYLATIQNLIEIEHADPNYELTGFSVLMMAIRVDDHDYPEVVEYLLSKGADPFYDQNGNTTLQFVAKKTATLQGIKLQNGAKCLEHIIRYMIKKIIDTEDLSQKKILFEKFFNELQKRRGTILNWMQTDVRTAVAEPKEAGEMLINFKGMEHIIVEELLACNERFNQFQERVDWQTLLVMNKIEFIHRIKDKIEHPTDTNTRYVKYYLDKLKQLWSEENDWELARRDIRSDISTQTIDLMSRRNPSVKHILSATIQQALPNAAATRIEKEEKLKVDQLHYAKLSASMDEVVYNMAAMVLLSSQAMAKENAKEKDGKEFQLASPYALAGKWPRYQRGLQLAHQLKPYIVEAVSESVLDDYLQKVDCCYQQGDLMNAMLFFHSADKILLARLALLESALLFQREELQLELSILMAPQSEEKTKPDNVVPASAHENKSTVHTHSDEEKELIKFITINKGLADPNAGENPNEKKSLPKSKLYTIKEALIELAELTKPEKTPAGETYRNDGEAYIHAHATRLLEQKQLVPARVEQTPADEDESSDAETVYRLAKQKLAEVGYDFSRLKEQQQRKLFSQLQYAAAHGHINAKRHLANFYYLGLHPGAVKRNGTHVPNVREAVQQYAEIILAIGKNDAEVLLIGEIIEKRLSRLKLVADNHEKELIAQCERRLATLLDKEKNLIENIKQNNVAAWVDLANYYLETAKEYARTGNEGGAVDCWLKAYKLGWLEAKRFLTTTPESELKGGDPQWSEFYKSYALIQQKIRLAVEVKNDDARKELEDLIRVPILKQGTIQLKAKPTDLQLAQEKYLLKIAADALVKIYGEDLFSYAVEYLKSFFQTKRLKDQAIALGLKDDYFATNKDFSGYITEMLQKFLAQPSLKYIIRARSGGADAKAVVTAPAALATTAKSSDDAVRLSDWLLIGSSPMTASADAKAAAANAGSAAVPKPAATAPSASAAAAATAPVAGVAAAVVHGRGVGK